MLLVVESVSIASALSSALTIYHTHVWSESIKRWQS